MSPPPSASAVDAPAHAARVAAVAAGVRAAAESKSLVSISKPGVATHAPHNYSYKSKGRQVDILPLTEILAIDVSSAQPVAVCEALVTMKQLVERTLPLGFVPQVVPEHTTFTVSGLASGQGIQSSCHRYGLFADTLEWIEVVTGKGDVIVCSSDRSSDHFDLYQEMPERWGSLGIVVSAAVRLCPAKPAIHTRYFLFEDQTEYVRALTALLHKEAEVSPATAAAQGALVSTRGPAVDPASPAWAEQRFDFIDGVVFSPTQHVLCLSRFADPADFPAEEKPPVFCPQLNGQPYFYQWALARAKGGDAGHEDLIETADYLFRSERGFYWMLECIVGVPAITNSACGRRHIDATVSKSRAQAAHFQLPDSMTWEEFRRSVVLQDMGISLTRLDDGIRFVKDTLGVYPLWTCPWRTSTSPKFTADYSFMGTGDPKETHLVDMGCYGQPLVRPYFEKKAMNRLYTFVTWPGTWGRCYLTRKEMDERLHLGSGSNYERVRDKYAFEGVFKSVHDKVEWLEESELDEEEPGLQEYWRCQYSYGRNWKLKLAFAGAAVLAAAGSVAIALCPFE